MSAASLVRSPIRHFTLAEQSVPSHIESIPPNLIASTELIPNKSEALPDSISIPQVGPGNQPITHFSVLYENNIMSNILDHIERTDRSIVSLNHSCKALLQHEVIRPRALEAICYHVFPEHKTYEAINKQQRLADILFAISSLPSKDRIKSYAMLLQNKRASNPIVGFAMYHHVKCLLREPSLAHEKAQLIEMHIQSSSKIEESQRFQFLFNAVPSLEKMENAEERPIHPGRLAVALIDVSEHYFDFFGSWMNHYITRLSEIASGDDAVTLFRSVISRARHISENYGIDALQCAANTLPHAIKTLLSVEPQHVLREIDLLLQQSTKPPRVDILKSVLSTVEKMENSEYKRQAFFSVIKNSRELPKHLLETAMLGIYVSLKNSGMLHDHGLCYANAKTIQILKGRQYKQSHLKIARYLPIFDGSKRFTGETIHSLFERQSQNNGRKAFLEKIKEYYRLHDTGSS